MIKGLYQQLEKGNTMHAMACSAMRDGDPQTSHDAGVLASRIEAEVKDIKALIDSDLQLVSLLDQVILSFDLTLSTSNRTLASRHIEDSQSRLIRELGDYPPVL